MPAPQKRPQSRWLIPVGLTLLLGLAVASLTQAVINAFHRSQDFQWSGARMLLHHIDPWAECLRGDPNHLIHLSQIPNYLPILYVLISPFGFLSLSPANLTWAACNAIFAIASATISARFYGIKGPGVFAVVCLMLMATPTRMTIGNGQQGLLVLILWCLSLLRPPLTDARSALAGVSYFKFNFAPPTFLYLLFKGGVRAVVMSALPSVAATVLIWLWLTHGSDVHELASLITEPFAVSRIGYFPNGGEANLMDVLQIPFVHVWQGNSYLPAIMVSNKVNAFLLASALLICSAVLYFAIRRHPGSSVQWQMALLATASFGLFKHHSYDSVVLIFPLCHALRLWRNRRAQVAIGAIVYMWYLERLVEAANFVFPTLFIFEFLVLMLLLAMTYQLRAFEETTEPGWSTLAGE